ncbi:MAG: restriction endonuclease [Bacteroidales bacterium]|nr:restriction endonuclease [Bacteroidales bacterium]
MANKGAALEQLVALIQETLKDRQDASIQTNVMLADSTGMNREIDVLVHTKIQEFPILIAFECKNYAKKAVDVQVVDAFIGKCKYLPQIHQKVIVSTSGFTANATARAEQEGIKLCPIEEIPLYNILSEYLVFRPIPNFQVGETFSLTFDSNNLPYDTDILNDGSYLIIENAELDLKREVYKEIVSLESQMELAKKYMENERNPFVENVTLHFDSGVYIKCKNECKYNVSEIKVPVLIDFVFDNGKIVKQQKLVQGGNVYITENEFRKIDGTFSTLVIEGNGKTKLLFKHGDEFIEPSIRIES